LFLFDKPRSAIGLDPAIKTDESGESVNANGDANG